MSRPARRLFVAPLALAAGLGALALLSAPLVAAEPAPRAPAVTLSVDEVTFVVDAPQEMGRMVTRAAEVSREQWPTIASVIGAVGTATVEVAIERDIADWFTRHGVAPRNPEWAAGLALFPENVVIVKSTTPDWEATLRHELAHVAIDLASGDGGVPRWAHEGIAVVTAEQWSFERASTMVRAGLTGSFYPFADLTNGFPDAASSADLAYAQSLHFVRYLQQRHGADVFARVLSRMRSDRAGWAAAFEAVVGRPQATVEAEWADYVRNRYRWAPAATGGGGAWGLVTVVGLLAWRRRRRASAARLEEMTARERGLYAPDPDDEVFG